MGLGQNNHKSQIKIDCGRLFTFSGEYARIPILAKIRHQVETVSSTLSTTFNVQ
jgi:hypothetical protein